MTPETAQRLLHSWPEWDRSVIEARERLGYDPAWRPEIYTNDLEDPYGYWWHVHDGPWPEVGKVLESLGLPWQNFADYWEACFFSDYDSTTLDRVRDFDRHTGRLERVLPPADAFLVVEFEENATTGRRRIQIYGPVDLATPEVIRDGAERAIEAVKLFGDVDPHPVVAARRSLAVPNVTRSDRMRERSAAAQQLLSEGRSVLNVARTLGISPRTVREYRAAVQKRGKDAARSQTPG